MRPSLGCRTACTDVTGWPSTTTSREHAVDLDDAELDVSDDTRSSGTEVWLVADAAKRVERLVVVLDWDASQLADVRRQPFDRDVTDRDRNDPDTVLHPTPSK